MSKSESFEQKYADSDGSHIEATIVFRDFCSFRLVTGRSQSLLNRSVLISTSSYLSLSPKQGFIDFITHEVEASDLSE